MKSEQAEGIKLPLLARLSCLHGWPQKMVKVAPAKALLNWGLPQIRPRRSMADNIPRTLTSIGYGRKHAHNMAVLALDIEKAFDSLEISS